MFGLIRKTAGCRRKPIGEAPHDTIYRFRTFDEFKAWKERTTGKADLSLEEVWKAARETVR
jgi:hypothetical protein